VNAIALAVATVMMATFEAIIMGDVASEAYRDMSKYD
jgi:hypothetical protein